MAETLLIPWSSTGTVIFQHAVLIYDFIPLLLT